MEQTRPTATPRQRVEHSEARINYVRTAILQAVDKRLDDIHNGGKFHGTLTVEVAYQDGNPLFIRGTVSESVKLA